MGEALTWDHTSDKSRSRCLNLIAKCIVFSLLASTVISQTTKTCSSGNYLDSSSNSCKTCPKTCSTCTSSTSCTSCSSGFYQSSPTACSTCPSLCLECSSAYSCSSCKSGSYFSQNTCISCSSNCKTCTGSGTQQCTACNSGYFLSSNTNVGCITCSQGCEVCSTGTSCSKCFGGYTLQSDGTCKAVLSTIFSALSVMAIIGIVFGIVCCLVSTFSGIYCLCKRKPKMGQNRPPHSRNSQYLDNSFHMHDNSMMSMHQPHQYPHSNRGSFAGPQFLSVHQPATVQVPMYQMQPIYPSYYTQNPHNPGYVPPTQDYYPSPRSPYPGPHPAYHQYPAY